jgi:hypothetical protein
MFTRIASCLQVEAALELQAAIEKQIAERQAILDKAEEKANYLSSEFNAAAAEENEVFGRESIVMHNIMARQKEQTHLLETPPKHPSLEADLILAREDEGLEESKARISIAAAEQSAAQTAKKASFARSNLCKLTESSRI